MRVLLQSFLCLIFLTNISSGSGDAGTESPFAFGTGARDLALGGSSLANCDATTAPYWNASGLTGTNRLAISSFLCRLYFSDFSYQYFGLAMPTLDYGNFGLGIFRLGIDGIEKRDASNLLLGEVSDNWLAIYLAYGYSVSNYNLGLALNLEQHSLDSYSSTSSPGLNLSASRNFKLKTKWLPEITASLSGRNILSPRAKLAYKTVDYPVSAEAGVAATLIPPLKWNQSTSISAKLTKTEGINPGLAIGLEHSLYEMFHIRGGLRENKLSAGFGINYRFIKFDYALVDRDLGLLHMFNLMLEFGKSVDEKRKIRDLKREAEFNQLMQKRLTSQSNEMVTELVREGKKFLEDENYDRASTAFDRALFIAQNVGVDTSDIHELAEEARYHLEEARVKKLCQQHLDSATVRFESSDYITARYFVQLALSKCPESRQAIALLDNINNRLNELSVKTQMVERRLSEIDSLVNHGYLGQAYSEVIAISQYETEDIRVRQMLKRVRFEHFRETASSNYLKGNYRKAVIAVDSALALYPGHSYCVELRQEISRIVQVKSPAIKQSTILTTVPPDSELLKKIDKDYQTAQRLFEQGDLAKAIENWEYIEKVAPDYQSVRQYLINAYKFVGIESYSRNQRQKAIGVWEKALDLDPANQEIESYIERARKELEQLEEISYDQK